MVEQRLPKLRT